MSFGRVIRNAPDFEQLEPEPFDLSQYAVQGGLVNNSTPQHCVLAVLLSLQAVVRPQRSVPLVVWQETFRRMRFPGSLYQFAFEAAVGRWIRRSTRRFIPRTTRARDFLGQLGIEDSRITGWIPTGIDTAAYSPHKGRAFLQTLGWPEDSQVLLLVGRLHRTKGVDFALRLLRWLSHRQPRVRLVIRGSGPEFGRLRHLALELGVADSVRFLDRLSREKMVELYNAADIVLSTSENDLLPFTLIEASACGRPCVSSDVGAVRDIVVDGVTGMVIKERTIETFGEAILALLQDEERRASYSREARARAHRRFALPIVAEQLSEVYRGVAG